jgi:hypothetical protein
MDLSLLHVTGANVHDSHMFNRVLDKVMGKVKKPDAGYKTPHIAKHLIDQEILPVLPYSRPRTKKGYFKKKEYAYDEHHDCYICPEGQVLQDRTTTREGYRQSKTLSELSVSFDVYTKSKPPQIKDLKSGFVYSLKPSSEGFYV